jgi:hypothetical protein
MDIGMRIDQGVPNTGLCCEMHDERESMRREQFRHGLALGNIGSYELEVVESAEFRDACFLQAGIVLVIDVVEAHDLMPVRQQAPRDMHADESGRAGDKNWLLQDASFRGAVTLPSYPNAAASFALG